MAALTNKRTSRVRKIEGVDLLMAANAKIYTGAWTVLAAGYLKQGLAAAGLTMAGKASDTVDNTGGADGALSCHVDFLCEKTLMPFIGDPANLFTQANVGGPAYLLDDQTATTVSSGHTSIGTMWMIDLKNGVQTVWVEVGHG